LGKRNRRDAKEIAFHRRSHGARVERVVAHVGAVVDARQHQVGPLRQHPSHGQVHTIRRRAVDDPEAFDMVAARFKDRQRPAQRERVGRAAGVLFGGDDVDLTEPFAGPHQGGQSRSKVSVVVGNEDAHAAAL